MGASLGRHARAGDVFLLSGELGSGKTCLTQGIGRGLGVKGNVRSPTFVLVSVHQGRMPLYHMDLYRLDHLAEVLDMGLEEYLAGDGVSVIEWADKAPEAFPPPYMLVTLSQQGDTERLIQLEPQGQRYEELALRVQRDMQRPRGPAPRN